MGQQILGRKQKISNDAWLKAMEQIEDLVSKQELDEKVRHTVKDIKATTGGKKAAVAWSGGKDSLVLADVCRQAGIEDSVLVVSNLEYKAFTDWVAGFGMAHEASPDAVSAGFRYGSAVVPHCSA